MAEKGTLAFWIGTNAPDAADYMHRVAARQVPFALSTGVNATAAKVLESERKRIPTLFPGMRSRNPPKRLQLRKSHKRQHPNVHAVIGHRDKYMADHALGEIRRPTKAKRMAIPTSLVKRTATGKKRKGHRPVDLLDAQGFIRGDLLRKRRGRRRKGGYPTPPWYLLRKSVRIRQTWDFHRGVQVVFRRHYGRDLKRAFLAALKSAKGQPGRFTEAQGRKFYREALRHVPT